MCGKWAVSRFVVKALNSLLLTSSSLPDLPFICFHFSLLFITIPHAIDQS